MPPTPSTDPARKAPASLSRAAILVFAIACGVCVANVYFPQALSPLIARSLHATPSAAALLVTTTQLGYAAGLYLLVPLGDRVRPRLLIVTLIILTAASLVAAGAAPSLAFLLVAGTAVGITTIVPQILLPMTAGLVPERRRGAVTGTLLSGLLGGILLARTFSGALGGWLDWRAPYLVAAVLMLVLAVVLARALPASSPPSQEHYGALLAAPVRLMRAEPDLRRSCAYQALMFGTFSAAWTSIALLLTGPSYGLSTQAVGVFALIGAGAVLVTPVAGRRIDRVGPDRISLVSFAGGLGAAALLALAAVPALHGAAALVLLGAGMLLLDVAVQSGQVANQARIFGLPGSARARRNTAYMTCTFLGGSAGSWIGIRAYSEFGWGGIAGLTALASAAALTRHLAHRRSASTAPASQAEEAGAAAADQVSCP
ncbi:MAG: transporter [Actinomycetia bacterium]|nr:transporter [Actinomycetes bacterium]